MDEIGSAGGGGPRGEGLSGNAASVRRDGAAVGIPSAAGPAGVAEVAGGPAAAGDVAAATGAGRSGGPAGAAGPVPGPAGAAAGLPIDLDADPGTLYVVATPIGNLGDVTLRSLEILRSVPLVAAEDTRITRRLFARHGITTHLVPHHARNETATIPGFLAHLRAGRDLALVTDAGTPLVSDPGAGLVAAWAADGGRVVPIPGPSAVLAALVASGIAGPRWSFEGFLPRRGRERRDRLARLAADERTTVLFEAPGRLAATLADLATSCGADRPAAVCRELTKLHEETIRGTLGTLSDAADAGRIDRRGEIVIVIGQRPVGHAQPGDAEPLGTAIAAAGTLDVVTAARAEVSRLVAGGLARGDAARRVAAATGLPRRRLYDAPDAGSVE